MSSSLPLTKRQREIVRLIALGSTGKEIANLLNISVKTAETHRSNIMRRLGYHSITDLVYYAIREGLVQLEEGLNGKAKPRHNSSFGKIRGTNQTSNRTA